MGKFVLTAELMLRPPPNIGQVVSQMRNQLKNGITVDVKVKVPKNQVNATKQINASLAKTTKAAHDAGEAIKSFGESSALAFKRFFAFSIATGGFITFVQSIKKGIKDTIDFERGMIKVAQATGESIASTKSLSAEISRLSTTLGVSSRSLSEVALILAQAGLSARDTKRSLEALAKTELAPTFDNIVDTAEGAIAIFQQFGVQAKDLEKTLSSINSVAAKFAVESGDITTAIRRTGGAFEAAGGNLNQLMALFTSVRATTRESAESIATGFRTIFTRLQRIRTQSFLEALGIDVLNEKGLFKGPYEAIRELSRALKDIEGTDPRFAQIIEELGGFRQISKVIPLIKQFEISQRALAVAQQGTNSLSVDAAKAQNALAIQIAKVREEFSLLIRNLSEDSVLRAFVNTSLKLASALIQVADAARPLIPLIGGLAAINAYKFGSKFFSGFADRKRLGFNRGGLVPGSGNRDTVPADLTPGEFVIKKSAVRKVGIDNLRRLNGFVKGGDSETHGLSQRDFERLQKKGINPAELVGKDKSLLESLIGKAGFKISDSKKFAGILSGTRARNVDLRMKAKVAESKISPEGAMDFGLVSLKPVGFRGDPPVREVDGTKVRILRRGLPKSFADSSDKYISKELKNTTTRVATAIAKKTGASGINTSNIDSVLRRAGFSGAVGHIFEGALALAGAPYDDKPYTNYPIDFPSGVGDKLGKLFKIPGNIPTDATRNAKNKPPEKYETQIANFLKIRAGQPPKKFASGGMVDTVPAMLTPGEFVINKQSAQRLGPRVLNALNRGQVQGFAKGGVVGNALSHLGPGSSSFALALVSSLFDGFTENTKSMERMNRAVTETAFAFGLLTNVIDNDLTRKLTRGMSLSQLTPGNEFGAGFANPFGNLGPEVMKKIRREERAKLGPKFGPHPDPKARREAIRAASKARFDRFRRGAIASRASFLGTQFASAGFLVGGNFLSELGSERIAKGQASGGVLKNIGGALSGAGAGASIGSILGPKGAVGGALVGALIGLVSAVRKSALEIQKVRIDKSLTTLSNKLDLIASDKGDPLTLSGSISQTIKQQRELLVQARGSNLEDLQAGIQNSIVNLSVFVDKIAQSSNSLEEFIGKVGNDTIEFFAEFSGSSRQAVIDSFLEELNARNKSAEAINKEIQARDEFSRQVQTVLGINRSFAQLDVNTRIFNSSLESLIGSIDGRVVPSFVDFSDDIRNSKNLSDPSSLLPIIRRDAALLSARMPGSRETIGQGLSRDVEGLFEAQKLLPQVLLSLRGISDIENEDAIIAQIENAFDKFPSFIREGVSSQVRTLIGQEGKPAIFLEKLSRDFFGTVDSILDGVGKELLNSSGLLNSEVSKHNNRLAQLFDKRIEIETRKLDNIDQNVQIEKERIETLARIRGNPANQAALFGLETSRQATALPFELIDQPLRVAAQLMATRNQLEAENIKLQSGTANVTLEQQAHLANLNFQAERLNSGLKLIAETARNRVAPVLERIGELQGARAARRGFVQRFSRAESFEDIRSLGMTVASLQRFIQTRNIESIPKEFRAEVSEFLESLPENSSLFPGLQGFTPKQILEEIDISAAQKFFGLDRAGAIAAAGLSPTAEENQLKQLANQLYDLQQQANNGLNLTLTKANDDLANKLLTVNSNFLQGLNSVLVGDFINTLRTEGMQRIAGRQSLLEQQGRAAGVQGLLRKAGANISVEQFLASGRAIADAGETLFAERALKANKNMFGIVSVNNLENVVGKRDNYSFSIEQADKAINAAVEKFNRFILNSTGNKGLADTLSNEFRASVGKSRLGIPLGKGVNAADFASNLNKNINEFFNTKLKSLEESSIESNQLLLNLNVSAEAANYISANFKELNASLANVPPNLNKLTEEINSATNHIHEINARIVSAGGQALSFRNGGKVPGYGRGDKVPAMLEPGEFVLNRKTVNAIGANNLERMQTGGAVQRKLAIRAQRKALRDQIEAERIARARAFDPNFDKKQAAKAKNAERLRKLAEDAQKTRDFQAKVESDKQQAQGTIDSLVSGAKSVFGAVTDVDSLKRQALQAELQASIDRAKGGPKVADIDLIGKLRGDIQRSEDVTTASRYSRLRTDEQRRRDFLKKSADASLPFSPERQAQESMNRARFAAEKKAAEEAQVRELIARQELEKARLARRPSALSQSLSATGQLASVAGGVLGTAVSLPARAANFLSGGTLGAAAKQVAKLPGIRQGIAGVGAVAGRARKGRDIIEQAGGGGGRLATGVFDLTIGALAAVGLGKFASSALPTATRVAKSSVPIPFTSRGVARAARPGGTLPSMAELAKRRLKPIGGDAAKSDLGVNVPFKPNQPIDIDDIIPPGPSSSIKTTPSQRKAIDLYNQSRRRGVNPKEPRNLKGAQTIAAQQQERARRRLANRNAQASRRDSITLEQRRELAELTRGFKDNTREALANRAINAENRRFNKLDKSLNTSRGRRSFFDPPTQPLRDRLTNIGDIPAGTGRAMIFNKKAVKAELERLKKLRYKKSVRPSAQELRKQRLDEIQDRLEMTRGGTKQRNFEQINKAIRDQMRRERRVSKQKRRAGGGLIGGYGEGDRVPALLEPGEFVLNRNAVGAIGLNKLSRANSKFARFQSGGQVQSGGGGTVNVNADSLKSAVEEFNSRTENLVAALNSFPREIQINAHHTVEVIHNGAQVFATLTPEIQKLVESQTKSAINNMLKSKFPDVGTV